MNPNDFKMFRAYDEKSLLRWIEAQSVNEIIMIDECVLFLSGGERVECETCT